MTTNEEFAPKSSKILSVFLFLLILGASIGLIYVVGRPPQVWAKKSSSELGYSVDWPSDPILHDESFTNKKKEKVAVKRFTIESLDGRTSLSLTVRDNPSGWAESFHFGKWLERTRAGIQKSGGKLLMSRPLKMEGVPGYEIRMKTGNDFFNVARLYVRGERAYQLSVVVVGKPVLSQDGDRFLKSFRLVKAGKVP